MLNHNRYHHIHHHPHTHEAHCQMNEDNQFRNSRRNRAKDNYENTTEPEVHQVNNENSESTDTSSCMERVTHTLPVRKVKKRTAVNSEVGSSVKSCNQQAHNKTNVQNVFGQGEQEHQQSVENDYHEPQVPENNKPPSSNQSENQPCRYLPRLQGVENAAFQKQETSPQKPETTESEVYFADVSSCCNISVRNDGQDSSLYDEALEGNHQKSGRLMSLNSQLEEQSKEVPTTMSEEDDYLAQRMAHRQMSTRSRMPFPLPSSEDLGDSCMQLIPKDPSQTSLCSSLQTPLTETTEATLSPDDCCPQYYPNDHHQFLAPDAQYEIIPESSSNLTNTISGVGYDQTYYNAQNQGFNNFGGAKNIPPNTLNLNNQSGRRHIGSNISALIQNLGGNPAGLLYGDAKGEEEVQGQSCHSDGTMDSGWQSGSEKPVPEGAPVNV